MVRAFVQAYWTASGHKCRLLLEGMVQAVSLGFSDLLWMAMQLQLFTGQRRAWKLQLLLCRILPLLVGLLLF